MENLHEIDDDTRHSLKVKLKKLGIFDVDEHISQIIGESESRHNRQLNSKTAEKLKTERNVRINDSMPKVATRKSAKIIKVEGEDDENETSLSSMLAFAKNRKRNSESDDEVKRSNKFSRQKKLMSIDSNSNSCASSNYDLEDDENASQIDEFCSIPGCDSSGHLSGAFDSHTSIETCPKFHNQTNEECVQRFKHRQEIFRKKTRKSHSPTKRSPTKKSVKKTCNLKNDDKWNKIMDQRKKDLAHSSQATELIIDQSTTISSREPNLEGFTPKFDLELFKESQSRAAELMHFNLAGELKSSNKNSDSEDEQEMKPDQTVVLGSNELNVWYSSPYSNEFQNCKTLFICEFCLKCMSSPLILERHALKCELKHPPGTEIYRKDEISFFEVDGNKQKEYCQNLCLFAKLFLNHKTLFFDVEPFLFYIMTVADSSGMHIVGYFSKEKVSSRDYNVSCILTIPAFQRSGYGRMLIDFSYLLTRTEGKVGSPEMPISDLGIISYRSYWKFIIKEYLITYEDKNISLKDMSQQTGINANDIVSTLQDMRLLKYWKGEHLILLPEDVKKKFTAEVKEKRRQYGKKVIDATQLTWTKTVYSL